MASRKRGRIDGAVLLCDAGGNPGQLGDAPAVVEQVAHDLVHGAPRDLIAQHLPDAFLRFAHLGGQVAQHGGSKGPCASSGCSFGPPRRRAESLAVCSGRCSHGPLRSTTCSCARSSISRRQSACGRSGSAMRRSRPMSGPGSSGARAWNSRSACDGVLAEPEPQRREKDETFGAGVEDQRIGRQRHAIGGVTRQVHQIGHRHAVARVLQQRRNAGAVEHLFECVEMTLPLRGAPLARRRERVEHAPPPTVCAACASRTMKRSPGVAHSGVSNTSWTRADSPADRRSDSSRTTWATRCVVSRCTCSGAHDTRCKWLSASNRRRGRCGSSGANRRGSASQSPRGDGALVAPATLIAQRSPAWPLRPPVGAWMPRTRAGCPPAAAARNRPPAPRPRRPSRVTTAGAGQGEAAVDRQAESCHPAAPAGCAPPRAAARAAPQCRAPGAWRRAERPVRPGQRRAFQQRRDLQLHLDAAQRRRPDRSWSAPPRRASRPSRSRMARCSRVCGITPSSAATTSSARSMPCAPASMLRTKRSWPGHVDEARALAAARQRRIGKAEVDGDAARLLLRQAVGVDAGQRARPARSCRGRYGRRCRRSWRSRGRLRGELAEVGGVLEAAQVEAASAPSCDAADDRHGSARSAAASARALPRPARRRAAAQRRARQRLHAAGRRCRSGCRSPTISIA